MDRVHDGLAPQERERETELDAAHLIETLEVLGTEPDVHLSERIGDLRNLAGGLAKWVRQI